MDDYARQLHELEEIAEWGHLDERRRRKFTVRRDPFEYYTEAEFIQRYRLSKVCFNDLLTRIADQLPTTVNKRGLRIPPRLQFLVALRYMATGNFQLTLGDCADISQPSVSKCVRNVSAAIASLAPEYVRFPDPGNEEETMQQFSLLAGMPGVIGSVDGTHIPIKSPGGPDAELYRCRKNFFSINVMGVCDANLKFTNIVVNWPGSAHDARVFSETRLAESLESGAYKGFLLGDNGYACRSYLLTPFLTPGTDKERHYNASHIRTRNTIERTFGILKRRFAILSIPVRTKLVNTENIILACAVLHNVAIMNRLPLEEPEDVGVEVPEIPEIVRAADNIQGGRAHRADIVNLFF